jgi:hypothetical protein
LYRHTPILNLISKIVNMIIPNGERIQRR